MIESERKYLGASRPHLRRRLRELGAISERVHFESNIIYDTPEKRFYKTDRLLRLRSQEWHDKMCNVLTLKRPIAGGEARAIVKIREELEVVISDASLMGAILAGCGFEPVARYEKMREQWHFEKSSPWAHLNVDLDLLPFGFVVEIEGAPAGIDSLADALALDKNKISLKTYHELNQEWRMNAGLPASFDLVFESAKRSRLRKSLGLA